EVRSTLACGVRSRKKMRIGVDHLATSERVDCEEIKDIAMYGGEGLRGECKHPLVPETSCLLHISPGKQHDRECPSLRQSSRSKRPRRARPGVVRDTGSLAMVWSWV